MRRCEHGGTSVPTFPRSLSFLLSPRREKKRVIRESTYGMVADARRMSRCCRTGETRALRQLDGRMHPVNPTTNRAKGTALTSRHASDP